MIITPDIRLTECGEQDRTGEFCLTAGETNQYLIILSGVRTVMRINDRQYYMRPFTFLVHPFDEERIHVDVQGTAAYRYLLLSFSDRYLEKIRGMGLTERETHTLANPLAVEEIWKLLLPAMEVKNPAGMEIGIHALELLMCLILEASDGTVTRAAEVPHYDKLTALRHKIYQSAFGTTCTQDVIASRIACSKRLLETTEDPITTVSQLSGFETDVYFMRQFKRHVGMTPTAYRRIYRQSTAADTKRNKRR